MGRAPQVRLEGAGAVVASAQTPHAQLRRCVIDVSRLYIP